MSKQNSYNSYNSYNSWTQLKYHHTFFWEWQMIVLCFSEVPFEMMFITVISIILTFADFTFSLNANHTETTMTTEMCKPVNPYNYKFIIETTPCSTRDKILIVVHTSSKVSTCAICYLSAVSHITAIMALYLLAAPGHRPSFRSPLIFWKDTTLFNWINRKKEMWSLHLNLQPSTPYPK